MAVIVGGERARLIRESVYQLLNANLTALGWFNPTRPYLPIDFVSRSFPQDQQIPINSAALSDEFMTDDYVELGSQLSKNTWQMYVDFFADSDALGLHFIRDVQDILRGRFSSLGRTGTVFNVYDYTQPGPPVVFTCDIENVTVDRAHGFLKPWLEHWYACSFNIIDYYDSEDS